MMRASFLYVFAYLAVIRVLEVAHSKRNTASLLARGAHRVQPDGFAGIAAVHAAWFAGLLVEEAFVGPTLEPGTLRSACVGLAVTSELVRLTAVASLRDRWSMLVVVLPGVAPVRSGPYRWLRHPNYVAITVQLVALPLALGLVWTAVLVLPLKLAALRPRLRVENEALGAWTRSSPRP